MRRSAGRWWGAVLLALALACAAPASGSAAPATYYVALGDSLAAGYQPGAGDTDRGYVDVTAARLRATDPSLTLENFGCTGETITSLRTRSVCAGRYHGGSQLAAAAAFLAAHRGQVRYLTIDIGANDITPCARTGAVDLACTRDALAAATSGLATVLDTLHRADPSVTGVGVTYYDPFVAASVLGATAFAQQSVTLVRGLNLVETALYGRYGYRVADVATKFHTGETTPRQAVPNLGSQPIDIAYACRYTHICAEHDIHPNDAGYRLMAQVVSAALTR